MRIDEIGPFPKLGKSVKFNFYDIFQSVESVDGKLKIRVRRDRPGESRLSGIYVWYHPDWGYFYVGIASKNNFTERWNKHIQKLLDQCSTAQQMKNWKSFADKFKQAGFTINDLKDITLRFFPIANRDDFPGQDKEWKKYLSDMESVIVRRINPACNKEYKADRPTATKFPVAKQDIG